MEEPRNRVRVSPNSFRREVAPTYSSNNASRGRYDYDDQPRGYQPQKDRGQDVPTRSEQEDSFREV